MFSRSAMSEFKFACPVCGQRMAVDSSASGAQVECPTCFQIVIVPKAPAEGSKYQLSATQYLKPVILPPAPSAKAASPVVHQRKPAVLIFALILACAVVTALFVREKIVQSQRGQAAAPTHVVNFAVSPLWSLDLTNAVFPKDTAAGKIHGRNFVCRQAVLLHDFLALRSGKGWQSEMAANIFLDRSADSPRAAEMLSGRSFEVGTNQTDSRPAVSLVWQDGNLRVTELFTNGYAMKLEFGTVSSNRLPGKIYLCLPDETRSYVVGTFTAEIQRFPPRRSP